MFFLIVPENTVFFLIFPMQSMLDKLKFRFITLTANRQGVHSACQEENYRHKKYIVFRQKSEACDQLIYPLPILKNAKILGLVVSSTLQFNEMIK